MAISGEGFHLRDYLKIISKHRKTIAVFFVTTIVLAMIGTFAQTPRYQATTRAIIERASPDPLAGGNARYFDPEFHETQYQLIMSHAVSRRVVDMLSLEETYDTYMGPYEKPTFLETAMKWFKKQKRRIELALNPETAQEQSGPGRSRADLIAAWIRKDIAVEPVPNSRLVAIKYLSPNPEFAALVANTVARAYQEETLDMKMEFIRRTMAWMTKKAKEEEGKLEESEQKIASFMRTNNLVTLENRVAVLPQQLSQVGSDLVRAETRREELEALYQKVKKVASNPKAAETIPAIASDPALRTLQTQILEAEQTIMQLSGKYGQRHPAMIKARGDLNVLKEKKNQEIARIIESIKNEYELARSAETTLNAHMQRNKAEAQRTNEKFIQYQTLSREMETNRQLYDALMGKIKEQSITGENQPVVNFWIVEEAGIPSVPAEPRKMVNAVLGLLVGLFGGVGLAIFTEYLDNTVKDPEETETVLGVPVLGVISLCERRQPLDVVTKEPRSAFTENYKALRTSLLLSSADGAPGRILITSPGTGEGKTTTAVNLAMVLAQSDKRVLLIDGDLRKPRLHKIFDIGNKKGLSTYLAGSSGGDILGKGSLPRLAVIPSGPVPPNPSELLTSSRMETLLNTLSEEFDIIICDSPPLLSVADSRILSRYFDATVLVVLGGKTTYEIARRSLKLLSDVKARMLGLVINALDVKKNDYYYNQYYASYEEEQKKAEINDRLERIASQK
jgi:capsular exopolysaccharide synthesis family protein